jgi:hypothetical protein
MTDEEDLHNGVLNDIIQRCPHTVVRNYDGDGVRCGHCAARFAPVLFPRKIRCADLPHTGLKMDERTESLTAALIRIFQHWRTR